MQATKAFRLVLMGVGMLLPAAAFANKFDGNWMTHLNCEQHGQMAAYKWDFPSTIKDGVFHGQHSTQGQPGYLVIDGKVDDTGKSKLNAKGTVTESKASGVFALKGNNYSYTVKAQFMDTTGTGARDEGAGILGRGCTFNFDKTPDSGAAPTPDAAH
jgi:hypothetical protein